MRTSRSSRRPRTSTRPRRRRGVCDDGDVGYGVRSQGVEIEASARVTPDLRVNAGITYADTRIAGTSWVRTMERRSTRRFVACPAAECRTRRRRWSPDPCPGPRRSAEAGSKACSTSTPAAAADSTRAPTCSRRSRRTASRSSMAASGSPVPTSVGHWSCGRRTCSTRTTSRSRSTRRSRKALPRAPFTDPQFPGGRQIFSSYLAEPRTYGLTLRARFNAPRPVAVEAPPPPPPPPPGHADLRGRIGDPGDRGLPGPAASAASTSAGARARLIGRNVNQGLAGNGGPLFFGA